jgi:MFS family permease
MTWVDSFAPLRNRNFAWYFASRFTDTLGTMMASVALAFAVLEFTDSATELGQVLAAHTIPMVIFMLYGGVLADRFPRTLVLQSSNLVAAAAQGTLAFLVISGQAELWMFLVLSAVNGLADAANFPAMAGMVPQLVPRHQLQPANALLSLTRGSLTIIGPSLSALLVVTVGPGWGLAVNAMAWLVSTALLVGVKIPPKPRKAEQTSTFQDLREGWTFFRATTWLWVVVLAFTFFNAIQTGAFHTLGPARAKDTIGEQGWGFVLSAQSAGLLVMTLVLLRVRLERPLLLGMIGCSLFGAPLIALGVQPDLWLLVILAFVAGAGVEVFNMGWNLAMQEHIEDGMLSRAYSYDALGSFVAIPVGQLMFGPLGDAFGFEAVLVVSGIAVTAISLVTLLSRSVRILDRAPSAAGTTSSSASTV